MAGFLAPILAGTTGTIALNLISDWIANSMAPKAPPLPTRAGFKAIVDPVTGTFKWLDLRTGRMQKAMHALPQPGKPGKLVRGAKKVRGATGALLNTALSAAPLALTALSNTATTAGSVAGPVVNTGLKMAFRAPAAFMPNVSNKDRELFGTVPGDTVRNLAALADDTAGIGQGIQQGAMATGQGMRDLATQLQLINIHKQLMGDTNSLGKQLKGMHMTPAELSYMEQIMRTMNPMGRAGRLY